MAGLKGNLDGASRAPVGKRPGKNGQRRTDFAQAKLQTLSEFARYYETACDIPSRLCTAPTLYDLDREATFLVMLDSAYNYTAPCNGWICLPGLERPRLFRRSALRRDHRRAEPYHRYCGRIHPTLPRRDQVIDGGARRTLGAPGRSGRAVGVGCHALRSDQQRSCTGALGAVAGSRGGNVGSGMGLIVV